MGKKIAMIGVLVALILPASSGASHYVGVHWNNNVWPGEVGVGVVDFIATGYGYHSGYTANAVDYQNQHFQIQHDFFDHPTAGGHWWQCEWWYNDGTNSSSRYATQNQIRVCSAHYGGTGWSGVMEPFNVQQVNGCCAYDGFHFYNAAIKINLSNQQCCTPPSQMTEAQRIALMRHELGHADGLAHYFDTSSLMWPWVDGTMTYVAADLNMLSSMYWEGTDCGYEFGGCHSQYYHNPNFVCTINQPGCAATVPKNRKEHPNGAPKSNITAEKASDLVHVGGPGVIVEPVEHPDFLGSQNLERMFDEGATVARVTLLDGTVLDDRKKVKNGKVVVDENRPRTEKGHLRHDYHDS